MFPIANVAPLFQIALFIYTQVGTAKKNVRYCRRLADEVRAMEPILKDIEARVNDFPQVTKEMIDRALDLLLKDFQAASDFIQKQKKVNVIKKFVIARTTEQDFQEINNHIRDSRDIFVLAMVNKIDANTSSPSTARLTPSPPPSSTASAPTPSTTTTPAPLTPTSSAPGAPSTPNEPKLSSPPSSPTVQSREIHTSMDAMRRAFNDKQFKEAVKIGKDLLKTVPAKSEACYVIYLSIACSYSHLNEYEDAMTYIHSARENGWDDVQYLESEDWNNLRNFPEFIAFKDKMNSNLYAKERWRSLPQDQVDQLTRNFERYDVDGSGTICDSEFRVLMKRTSTNMSESAVQELFAAMDTEKTGQIDLNGFLNYMADHRERIPGLLRQPSVQDVTASFQDFSLSPHISFKTAAHVVGALHHSLSMTHAHQMNESIPAPHQTINSIPAPHQTNNSIPAPHASYSHPPQAPTYSHEPSYHPVLSHEHSFQHTSPIASMLPPGHTASPSPPLSDFAFASIQSSHTSPEIYSHNPQSYPTYSPHTPHASHAAHASHPHALNYAEPPSSHPAYSSLPAFPSLDPLTSSHDLLTSYHPDPYASQIATHPTPFYDPSSLYSSPYAVPDAYTQAYHSQSVYYSM